MSAPSFSVCIPNFNHGRFIGETIESVLRQTYDNYEIVVVDNASTDNSVQVVEALKSDKIRLYQNEYNVGFAPNLDRAASKARNEFIIVLSSDDVMMPCALQTYAAVIRDWGKDATSTLIVSAYEVIDETGAVGDYRDRLFHFTAPPALPCPVQMSLSDVLVFAGKDVFKDVFPRMSVPGPFCSTAYARTLYDRVGGYSSTNLIGVDAHFAYKCLLGGAWVTFVDKPLFRYRIHSAGQLGQSRRERILRVPVDRYLFTFLYSDQQLEAAGVHRREIVDHLIDEACIRDGMREVALGSTWEGLRHAAFALATFPRIALRRLYWWGLVGLVLLGPAGTFFVRALVPFRGKDRGGSGRVAK